MYRERFILAYALLGATAIASIVLTFLFAFTPVTPLVRKADAGPVTDPALVQAAERAIAKQAAAANVTIRSQRVVKVVRPNENTVIVRVKLDTLEVGPVVVDVTFSKGIYQLSGMAQTG